MADFAVPTDVETAYEGSLPAGSEARVQYLLTTVSARLRTLVPSLVARIEAAEAALEPPELESDLTILARDVVVQAVIRRLPSSAGPQIASQTQNSGPYAVTYRYTQDRSQTFTDDDLALLSGEPIGIGGIGSIRTGRPDWSMQ